MRKKTERDGKRKGMGKKEREEVRKRERDNELKRDIKVYIYHLYSLIEKFI